MWTKLFSSLLMLLLWTTPLWATEFAGDPLTRFSSELFVGSGKCAVCHHLLYDKQGKSLSIKDDWRSTMMANAATDPFWQAKVSSEISRNPALKKIIEQKCLACHMPMAEIEAERTGLAVAFKPGFYDINNELHAAAMDGVSCSLCHQIQPDNLGRPESFSGQYVLDRSTAKPARTIFGPFQETDKQTMRTSVGYDTTYGSHLLQSSFCATCHTLYTPFIDASGKIGGKFPEQTPYLEWLASNYSHDPDPRSCQQCHMPTVDEKVKIANFAPRHVKAKENFAKHHFVGGNSLMLGLLQNNVSNLQLTASSSNLARTKQRTKRQLQENTAHININNVKLAAKILTATVQIKSMTGHKFPTGIPGRRAWLHFTVKDARGKIVFESGKVDKDGHISGNDNDTDIGKYERHYDTITRPDQVQIYEAIMANTDGQVTYTLLRAAHYLKDNRILPIGFRKETVKDDIKVYGKAATDGNFIGGSDMVTYEVPVSGQAPYSIQADLLYTSVSSAWISDLNTDDTELVHTFAQAWQTTNKSPVTIAEAKSVIK